MTAAEQRLPEMSLQQLFASARAAGNTPNVVTLTFDFLLIDCQVDRGTLTITRNPTSQRWLTTLGVTQDRRYYARYTQGETADEALDKLEQQCRGWLCA